VRSRTERRPGQGRSRSARQGEGEGPRRRLRGLVRRAERRDDLGALGEPAPLVLRPDPPPVREDVELPASAGCHRRVDPQRALQLGRETRGLRVVAASGGTEEDLDAHDGHPSDHRRPHGCEWRSRRRSAYEGEREVVRWSSSEVARSS